jgi:hypothetical protein
MEGRRFSFQWNQRWLKGNFPTQKTISLVKRKRQHVSLFYCFVMRVDSALHKGIKG